MQLQVGSQDYIYAKYYNFSRGFFCFFLLHAKELISVKQEAAKLRINSLRGQLI